MVCAGLELAIVTCKRVTNLALKPIPPRSHSDIVLVGLRLCLLVCFSSGRILHGAAVFDRERRYGPTPYVLKNYHTLT